jgi:hypothetical protein
MRISRMRVSMKVKTWQVLSIEAKKVESKALRFNNYLKSQRAMYRLLSKLRKEAFRI